MPQSLGVHDEAQWRKLRSRPWSGAVMITAPDERGRPQQLRMILGDAVPLWLSTINPAKVAFEVRAKLDLYQCEAAKVLAAWFLGPKEERLARMADLDRRLAIAEHDRDRLALEVTQMGLQILHLKAEVYDAKA
jgi:hypothetical protein